MLQPLYLIPITYVPAEAAVKVTVVTPADVLMVELRFAQPDVKTWPAEWLKK